MVYKQSINKDMKLLELIFSLFTMNYHKIVYNPIVKPPKYFKDLYLQTYKNYKILNNFVDLFGKNVTLGLHADNSYNYIAWLLAMLIKNVNVYLIPTNLQKTSVLKLLIDGDINVLLVSDKTKNIVEYFPKMKVIPTIKLIANIEDNTILYERSIYTIVNESLDEEENVIIDIDPAKTFNRPIRSLRQRFINIVYVNDNSIYPSVQSFTNDSIYNGLMIILSAYNRLPILENKRFYTNLNYSESIIYSLLWPLYCGASIDESMDTANVALMSNNSFEWLIEEMLKDIFNIPIIGKKMLLGVTGFRFLTKLLLRKSLKKLEQETILLLNPKLSFDIFKVISKTNKITCLYGAPELNHIFSINDFKTKGYNKPNNVGEVFSHIQYLINYDNKLNFNAGSLLVFSDHLCEYDDENKYFDTRLHTEVKTSKDKTIHLYIYGHMSNIRTNELDEAFNLETIESIIMNNIFFKEVLLYPCKNQFYLLIYPNVYFASMAKFGLLDLKNYIKTYKEDINSYVKMNLIKDVKLVFEEFDKYESNLLKRMFYKFEDNHLLNPKL